MIADSFGRHRETKSAHAGLELHTEGPCITQILGLEKKVLCKIPVSGTVLKTQLTQNP